MGKGNGDESGRAVPTRDESARCARDRSGSVGSANGRLTNKDAALMCEAEAWGAPEKRPCWKLQINGL